MVSLLGAALLLWLAAPATTAQNDGHAGSTAAGGGFCAAWQALSATTIVVSEHAPAWEQFAANELAGQIAALTRLPRPQVVRCDLSGKAAGAAVATGASASEACAAGGGGRNGTIALGMSAAEGLFNLVAGDLSPAKLGPEGFVVTSNRTARLRGSAGPSYALAGTQMHTGPANSSHGTLFAAYHLLHALGVRFLTQDVTVYPRDCPAVLPALDVTFKPRMEQRTVYTWAMGTYPVHAMRSHQNMGGSKWPQGYLPASYGVSVNVATPPGSVHTSYTILGSNLTNARVPPDRLWQEHRQWFWPRSRKGAPDGGYGQLCWTNASLLEFVASQAIMYLRAQPHANLLDLSQNDNGNYCNTTEEQAVIAEEGSAIGPLLRAVNYVSIVNLRAKVLLEPASSLSLSTSAGGRRCEQGAPSPRHRHLNTCLRVRSGSAAHHKAGIERCHQSDGKWSTLWGTLVRPTEFRLCRRSRCLGSNHRAAVRVELHQ
jgi:hypothetical protein